MFEKKNQYGTCFVRFKILCNLYIYIYISYLDLSIQSYRFLKFKLQNCVNREVEGKGQKLNSNCIVGYVVQMHSTWVKKWNYY